MPLGHAITAFIGTGIDMSQLSHGASETPCCRTRRRRSSQASSMAMLPAMSLTRRPDVAACVGATWIGWGGRRHYRASGAEPAHRRESSSSASPTGGSYRRRKMLPRGVLPTQSPTFSCFQNFSRLSAALATTSLKWFWLTKTAGTDMRRPNGSPCADGSKPIPTTSWPARFAPN